jgi:hypothetical protein
MPNIPELLNGQVGWSGSIYRRHRMMIVASVVFKVSSFESSVVASALSILSREVPDSAAVRI